MRRSRSQGQEVERINLNSQEFAAHGELPVSLSPDPSGEFEEAKRQAVLFAMFSGDQRVACKIEWSALRARHRRWHGCRRRRHHVQEASTKDRADRPRTDEAGHVRRPARASGKRPRKQAPAISAFCLTANCYSERGAEHSTWVRQASGCAARLDAGSFWPFVSTCFSRSSSFSRQPFHFLVTLCFRLRPRTFGRAPIALEVDPGSENSAPMHLISHPEIHSPLFEFRFLRACAMCDEPGVCPCPGPPTRSMAATERARPEEDLQNI